MMLSIHRALARNRITETVIIRALSAALFAAIVCCAAGSAAAQTSPGPRLVSVTVTPTNPSLTVGATEQFTATGKLSNGTTRNLTSSATWTSSSAGIASVQSAGQHAPGLAVGLAAGSAMITATFERHSARTMVSVTSATVSSIFVSPAATTLTVGGTEQFTASATYTNGTTQNVTASATWSSSNTGVATVESEGQATPGEATGITDGSVSIKASFEGMNATASVTVSNSTSSGTIPLMDMTNPSQNYMSFTGGLYENSSDSVPTDHDSAGKAIASTIQPLDANGSPSADGKVVLASIGMSNAADEFGMFMMDASASTSVNHATLVIANGAKGGITACYWVVAEGPAPCSLKTENQFDRVRDDVLTPLGVTEQQVQAVWIKEANGGPGVSGCGANGELPCNSLCDPKNVGCSNTTTTTEAFRYEMQLGEILRAAKARWPNLKVAFLTSRIYAGYATRDLNPEPYAYEYGFSVKWLIEAQINQARTGSVDATAGDLGYTTDKAPWVAWGPYIWANGDIPRSDGLIWCFGQANAPCNGEVDYQNDGTHPDGLGQQKVAEGKDTPNDQQNLMYFFLNSPYTKAWFAAAK